MKTFASIVALLTAIQCSPTMGGAGGFCLNRDECKERKNELGLKTFKSGKYAKMGLGCFSKYSTLYWSEGGTDEQMTTTKFQGSQAKERVMCHENEQISTDSPTNEPTIITNAPTAEPTAEPTTEPTFLVFVSDINPIDVDVNETGENQTSTNSTLAAETVNENLAVYNDTSESDLSSSEIDDSVVAGEGQNVELKTDYLPSSSTFNLGDSLLEIGIAVGALASLLVAAIIHRRTKNRKSNEAIVNDNDAKSIETENNDISSLHKNAVKALEAASDKVDDMSCWVAAELGASSSMGGGSSSILWDSSGSAGSDSVSSSSMV